MPATRAWSTAGCGLGGHGGLRAWSAGRDVACHAVEHRPRVHRSDIGHSTRGTSAGSDSSVRSSAIDLAAQLAPGRPSTAGRRAPGSCRRARRSRPGSCARRSGGRGSSGSRPGSVSSSWRIAVRVDHRRRSTSFVGEAAVRSGAGSPPRAARRATTCGTRPRPPSPPARCRRSSCRCSAISSTLGDRPSSCCSCSTALVISGLSSLALRGHAHAPRVVAEVAADLADHGRHGERDEVRAHLGVEPVDRLDEAERARPGTDRRTTRRAGRTGGRRAGDPRVLDDDLVAELADSLRSLRRRAEPTRRPSSSYDESSECGHRSAWRVSCGRLDDPIRMRSSMNAMSCSSDDGVEHGRGEPTSLRPRSSDVAGVVASTTNESSVDLESQRDGACGCRSGSAA